MRACWRDKGNTLAAYEEDGPARADSEGRKEVVDASEAQIDMEDAGRSAGTFFDDLGHAGNSVPSRRERIDIGPGRSGRAHAQFEPVARQNVEWLGLDPDWRRPRAV